MTSAPNPAADGPPLGGAALGSGGFCRLSTFAVSQAVGEDVRAFLNGQFSSDVKTLAAGHWQPSSYSTPKGRALATFAVAAQGTGAGDAFWLVTRRSVAEPTFKRLAMFVMRSKVRWAHDTHALLGVCGAGSSQALAALLGGTVPAAGECHVAAEDSPLASMMGGATALAIGLGANAWWLVVPTEAVDATADALGRSLAEMSAVAWDAIEVAAGRAWVEEGTREAFVPQMLNLDLTGGISFKKGCYPGQEIVARTQYLGKVKRRMLRFAVPLDATGALPAPGTPVHAAADAEQALGQVVLAAPLAAGHAQLLAVLQMDLAEGASLHLGAADGVALEPLPLPYPLEAG